MEILEDMESATGPDPRRGSQLRCRADRGQWHHSMISTASTVETSMTSKLSTVKATN